MAKPSSRFTPNASIRASQREIDRAIGRVIDDLTSRDRISLRDANLLARIGRNDAIDIHLQARAITGAEKRFLREYSRAVGRGITRGNIQTAKQMQKLMADAYAQQLASSFSILRQAMGQWNTIVERELKYREATHRLVSSKFKLYIYDQSPIAEAEYTAGRLLLISERLKRLAEPAIYASLRDAFIESWDSIDTDAFPLVYRTKILELISEFQSQRKIKIHGAGVSTWEIYVDFEGLFGSYNDLIRGYHYGALTGEDGSDRVTLPYSGQVLKNPVQRRYAYWQAVWSGRPYFGGYPNLASRNTTQAKTRRRAFYASQVSKKNEEMRNLSGEIAESGGASAQQLQQYRNIADERKNIIAAGKKSLSDEFTPIDTTGQKEETIQARMAAWGNSAPYWIFLEEGQLQFAPRIPPRAVRYRFFNKVRRMISEMARIMVNKELLGITIDPQGRARLAKGFKPSELPFANINPKTPPGGLLPATLVRKQKSMGATVKRSAREAVAVSGNFAPMEKIEQEDQMFVAALERQQTEYREFISEMETAFGVQGYPVNLNVVTEASRTTGSSSYNEIKQQWAAIQGNVQKDTLTYREAYDRIIKSGTITDMDLFLYSMRFGAGDK